MEIIIKDKGKEILRINETKIITSFEEDNKLIHTIKKFLLRIVSYLSFLETE